MSMDALEERLEKCRKERRPVIAVVAVVGSTGEGAIDPLVEILELRERFRRRGLDFAVHCDAAWGGYFSSMYRAHDERDQFVTPSDVPISSYVNMQFAALREVDSITVDPHKAGYVPYPAGALCYRNSMLRDLVSLKAPVIFHCQVEPSAGIYGIEGSKPGAAAAAVYLAHQVIRPTQEGYGKVLGQCIWASKRLYCRLLTIAERDSCKRLRIGMLQMLPTQRAGKSAKEVNEELERVRKFVHLSDKELKEHLLHNPKDWQLFSELGSDQAILAYSFNFWDQKANGWNKSVERHNKLNDRIFGICSAAKSPKVDAQAPELILTASAFDLESYGKPFTDAYCKRLGVENPNDDNVSHLISTTMNPWATEAASHPIDVLDLFENSLRESAYQALHELGL
jgi:hypothetical protein